MDETRAPQDYEADSMAALRASKKQLRQRITSSLSQLSSDVVNQQSQKITDTVLNMQEYRNASRISVYLSMDGNEVQTTRIVKDALDSGKKIFVPYIYKRKLENGSGTTTVSLMDMLSLNSHQDYDSLKRDKWGIPSLASESVGERENCFGGKGISEEKEQKDPASGNSLDLIIMPGVAFDRQFGRLGHGKGYYDKFLSKCNGLLEAGLIKRMPALIGLALNEQMLPEGEVVPTTTSDWRVHGVATASGTFMA